MHYLFAIKLYVNAVLEAAPDEDRQGFRHEVRRQHVNRYLLRFYREHGKLPEGKHYLGMTRPLNLEIGMVDFDAVRSKVLPGSVDGQTSLQKSSGERRRDTEAV